MNFLAAGDEPNSMSDGQPAGHNTDGFDISADSVTVENSVVMNQGEYYPSLSLSRSYQYHLLTYDAPDDCLAINRGTTITFQNNKCSGGHGISIGSISSIGSGSSTPIMYTSPWDDDGRAREASASRRSLTFIGGK